MPRPRWSPEEDARLTEVWKDPAPIKTQLDKFPGRSERALADRAAALKLPDRRLFANTARGAATTFARLQKLIEARPSTTDELAVRAHVSKKTAWRFVNAHRARMHISKYRPRAANGYAAAVWAWGAGEDAKPPRAKTPNEIALKYYRRIRRDPIYKSKRQARGRIRYAIKTGRIVRRDPAALALFGTGPAADDA
jgi:hypothetical protein